MLRIILRPKFLYDIAFVFRSANEFYITMMIIENWAIKNCMKINKGKCELMLTNKLNDLIMEYKVGDVIKYWE